MLDYFPEGTAAIVSVVSLIVAYMSYRVAAKSSKQAERSTQLADLALRRASYEKVQSLPAVEVIGVVTVDSKTRVKLMVFNLRPEPLKIQCVKVYIFDPKARNIKNYILSKLEPFEWDYRNIEDIVWNPKGSLDDAEHYVHEAMEYTYVKEREVVLVTIPEYSQYAKYKFEVITSVGATTITSRVADGKTLFAKDYRQTID
ncbi:hypothetical protein [Thiomicrospira microaerophila]|uniref:hypothetical protein n=1 Tax=Thiomicrospira microaerophila TaxID=406020 RepID=UPI0005CB35EE|nr:hypothetical protein [Thiomicrospira microaerophila]